jgi:hypothetical protein
VKKLPAARFPPRLEKCPLLPAGSWKLEAGSWKLEAGSWKLEAVT